MPVILFALVLYSVYNFVFANDIIVINISTLAMVNNLSYALLTRIARIREI